MNDELVNPSSVEELKKLAEIPETRSSQATEGKSSKFAQVFGGILGGAVNLVLPGILPVGGFFRNRLVGGGIRNSVGNTSITDSSPDVQWMLNNSVAQNLSLLSIQSTVQNQGQQFTMFTNLLKSRHDAANEAIRNLKS